MQTISQPKDFPAMLTAWLSEIRRALPRHYCEASAAREAAFKVLQEVQSALIEAKAYDAFDIIAKERARIMAAYPVPRLDLATVDDATAILREQAS